MEEQKLSGDSADESNDSKDDIFTEQHMLYEDPDDYHKSFGKFDKKTRRIKLGYILLFCAVLGLGGNILIIYYISPIARQIYEATDENEDYSDPITIEPVGLCMYAICIFAVLQSYIFALYLVELCLHWKNKYYINKGINVNSVLGLTFFLTTAILGFHSKIYAVYDKFDPVDYQFVTVDVQKLLEPIPITFFTNIAIYGIQILVCVVF